MAGRGKLLLLDADVLIDYASTDPTILALVARRIGHLHVVRSVLREVSQITESECVQFGIEIVEPSLAQLLEAGAARPGRLSFNDRLCLNIARDSGWTCVTNDRALRKACGERRVPVWWGLELLLALVREDELDRDAAMGVATAIHESNVRHISAEILERFARKLERLG